MSGLMMSVKVGWVGDYVNHNSCQYTLSLFKIIRQFAPVAKYVFFPQISDFRIIFRVWIMGLMKPAETVRPLLLLLHCYNLVAVFCVIVKSYIRIDKAVPLSSPLTQWGRDKIVAVFQTTFSNAFYWMKIYQFRLIFVSMGKLTIFQRWFR